MKAILRFSYSEEVIPPRCRKVRLEQFHNGHLKVAIKEVSSTDAPIAIVAEHNDASRQFLVVYRWYAKRLWTAVRLCGTEPRGYTSHQKDWDHPVFPADVDLTTEWYRGENYDLDIRYTANKPKHEVAAELRRQVKDHLIIDGVFYRPAGEPRYVVMTFGLGRNHGGTAVMTTAHYNPNIAKSRYFSLLELDNALALATQIATNRGDDKSLPMKANGPTYRVLLPEAIRVNPNKQHGNGSQLLNQMDAFSQVSGGSPVVGLAIAVSALSSI